jgi:hypothetical protein
MVNKEISSRENKEVKKISRRQLLVGGLCTLLSKTLSTSSLNEGRAISEKFDENHENKVDWNLRSEWIKARQQFQYRSDVLVEYWSANPKGDCEDFIFWFYYDRVPKQHYGALFTYVEYEVLTPDGRVYDLEGHAGLVLEDKSALEKDKPRFLFIDNGYVCDDVIGPCHTLDYGIVTSIIDNLQAKEEKIDFFNEPLSLKLVYMMTKEMPPNIQKSAFSLIDSESMMEFYRQFNNRQGVNVVYNANVTQLS